MTILMIIAFGMNSVLLSEIKVMKSMGRSVIAFFAAESGIEEALFEHRYELNAEKMEFSGDLVNEASYHVYVFEGGDTENDCPEVVNYCIKSVGSYLGAKRAIRITR